MIDYSVFDSFCKVPTWNTSHALDERRFNDALSKVVHDKDFSPEAMGDYIRNIHSNPIWPKESEELQNVISQLISNAWTIKNYVQRD
jgi:hypothetical protein